MTTLKPAASIFEEVIMRTSLLRCPQAALKFLMTFLCMCVGCREQGYLILCVSENNFQELILSFHLVGPGARTWVFRLGSKHLCPLSHPSGFLRQLPMDLSLAHSRNLYFLHSFENSGQDALRFCSKHSWNRPNVFSKPFFLLPPLNSKQI